MNWWIFFVSILVNLPLGYYAITKNSLSVPNGAVAAGFIGITLFVFHPIFWILLVVFFGSSTLLTRYKSTTPVKQDALSLAEKGGERDHFQVFANAGIPLILGLVATIRQGWLINDLFSFPVVGVAISFAVVNADTWATELGVTSSSQPRWILNPLKVVPRGTSGGISMRGLFASFLASFLIAVAYSTGLVYVDQFDVRIFLIICFAGLLGSIIDSLLGASIQAQYYCSTCDKLTEKPYHDKCSTHTIHDHGLKWFSNDFVNLASVILTLLVCFLFLW